MGRVQVRSRGDHGLKCTGIFHLGQECCRLSRFCEMVQAFAQVYHLLRTGGIPAIDQRNVSVCIPFFQVTFAQQVNSPFCAGCGKGRVVKRSQQGTGLLHSCGQHVKLCFRVKSVQRGHYSLLQRLFQFRGSGFQ